MRKLVLYLCGFGLPDRSASALRALGSAAVLREAGYSVLVAGKFAQVPAPPSQPVQVHGFPCHDIRQPLPGSKCVDYTLSVENIAALVAHVGREKVAAIMAYNYPGFGLSRLISLGRNLGIPMISESTECTECCGREGVRPVTSLRRILESRWRNNSLVERAGNFQCATRWSQLRHPCANSLVLRVALDPAGDCWQAPPNHLWSHGVDVVRLAYSGSPGLGIHKDRLPLIVAALDRVATVGFDFRFAVVGMTMEDYLHRAAARTPVGAAFRQHSIPGPENPSRGSWRSQGCGFLRLCARTQSRQRRRIPDQICRSSDLRRARAVQSHQRYRRIPDRRGKRHLVAGLQLDRHRRWTEAGLGDVARGTGSYARAGRGRYILYASRLGATDACVHA